MNYHNFSISEFSGAIGGYCLGDEIALVKIDESNIVQLNDIIEEQILSKSRENISLSLFIYSGEIIATLDYITYTAGADSILNISPFKILTQLEATGTFHGYIMAFSKNFIEDTALTRKPPVSITQLLSADKGPYKTVTPQENNVLQICLERIYHYLRHKEHRLRKELVINTFYTFILEVVNIVFDSPAENTTADKSIKKTYIQKFIALLVKHAEKEHNPAFYADKLCISVQYLSLILKEVSGKTANAWIASYIITIAKVMLRKPDMTIQQITEHLNFSDQSSFGKFFKKHVGISPKKYREAHIVY